MAIIVVIVIILIIRIVIVVVIKIIMIQISGRFRGAPCARAPARIVLFVTLYK